MPSDASAAVGRVLLLPPTTRDAEAMSRLLDANGIACAVVSSMTGLCAEVGDDTLAVLVSEEAVTADPEPLAACVRAQPVWSDLPVIVLARSGPESPTLARPVAVLGNVSVLERPVRVTTLLSVVRSALRGRARQYEVRERLAELARAARALDASEQRYRALATASSNVAYGMSADWSMLLPLDGRGLVQSNAEPIRDWLERNIPPDEHARVREAIHRATAGKALFELEHRVVRPDGSIGWTLSRAVPMLNESGGILEWFGAAEDVTARKRAEEALRESEERFRQLADAMPQIVWAARPDGTLDYYNRRWFEYIGVTDAEAEGVADWAQYVHPNDLGRVGAAWSAALRSGDTYEVEFRVRGADEAYCWFLVRAEGIRDREGPVLRWFGTCTDIEQRKKAEVRDQFLVALDDAVRPLTEAPEITATYARLLGEHLGADRCAYADVEADQDTFNLTGDHNRGVPSIVGRYRFAEFGQQALRLMRADEPYVVEDVDHHVPPIGNLSAYRATMIRAVVCVPLHKGGRFVAAMAVHQRVPRRWSADEVDLVGHVAGRCWESIERARVQRELCESQERLAFSVGAGDLGTFYCPMPLGRIVWNEKCKEHFFLPPDAEVDMDRFYAILHPDDRERTREAIEQAVFDRRAYDIEYRTVAPDGRTRWVRAKGRAYHGPDGNPTRFDGVTLDITEQKRAEAERQALFDREATARAEAERAGRMKDEFLATLSHELRTPLNAILGWSQILAGGRPDAEDLAEGLRIIERNARAQTQIIEDLLDMSRIISGKSRLDVQRLDLASVVRAAVETVKPAADAKGVRLRAVLDPLAGPVSGDPNRLQQVFWNLLTNAVKFTPKGGQVQVLVERVNSHLEVSVIDTGEGIAPDFLPLVFDRFRQADATTTRRHGGLGLGLAIVKQLVELHGGSIRAKSGGIGKGSTFIVSVPLTVIHADAEPDPAPGRRHPVAGPVLPLGDTCAQIAGLRILVVDDEPDARALVKRFLTDCDAVVTTAASAREALDRLRAERPDVLVSDIGMPNEDGYALIGQVRALAREEGGETPAIALTAYARAEDRMRAVMAGFQHHVVKPVEPAELITMVASLVAHKRPK